MSDRCWMAVHVRKDQFDRFMEVTQGAIQPSYGDTPEEEGNALLIEDGEVNYGAYGQLCAAAEAGLTFIARHGAGDEYGPRTIVGIGGIHHDVGVDNDSYPVVRCSKGGPDEDDVRAVKAFLAAEEAAEKELGIHKEG